MTISKRGTIPALLMCATLTLAACGGGDSNDNASGAGSQQSAAPDTSGSASGSAGAGARASFPTPSAAPKGHGALPGIPAITANATDFTKEPKIAKGTGKAPGGLVVRDLIVGTGQAAAAGDTVNVRYEGALFTDGSVFDASWKAGSAPIKFPLSGVVPGFAGGIVGMKVGGRREIVIPAELGYGNQAQPGIPAGSVLVFVVDLVSTGQG